MEHQLGRIDIVTWQGRRIRDAHRPPVASLTLAALFGASALILLLRFAAGASLPLAALQVAFAILAASGALLLMRGVAGLLLRLQHR